MVNPAAVALFFISVYSASVKVAETFFDRFSSASFDGRLDKFFNQNAGMTVASQPEPQRVKVKFAPKPEPPKSNIVADIAETAAQAIGGLFQVGPGYDPEEQAFYNEMQRREKRKLKKKSGRHL